MSIMVGTRVVNSRRQLRDGKTEPRNDTDGTPKGAPNFFQGTGQLRLPVVHEEDFPRNSRIGTIGRVSNRIRALCLSVASVVRTFLHSVVAGLQTIVRHMPGQLCRANYAGPMCQSLWLKHAHTRECMSPTLLPPPGPPPPGGTRLAVHLILAFSPRDVGTGEQGYALPTASQFQPNSATLGRNWRHHTTQMSFNLYYKHP